jgi:hypothetical protein
VNLSGIGLDVDGVTKRVIGHDWTSRGMFIYYANWRSVASRRDINSREGPFNLGALKMTGATFQAFEPSRCATQGPPVCSAALDP